MTNDGDAPIRLSRCCSMRYERQPGAAIVRLAGEFDLSAEERFQEQVERLLDNETWTFMLDLRGLGFIDSTALRMFVQIDAIARRDGFDFAILCGDGRVRAVLRESGLDGVLPVIDPSGVVPASDSPI
jgi:anti-anti-sigma factor